MMTSATIDLHGDPARRERASRAGEARVRALRLRVLAGEGAAGRGALGLAERALERALERAAGALGEEVIVLGRLDASLSLSRSSLEASEAGQGGRWAERSLCSALERQVLEAARRGAPRARFADRAAAEAAYVDALLSGRSGAFPFSALGFLGASPGQVLSRAAGRGRLPLADLLAALARALSPSALLLALGPDAARAALERLSALDAPAAMSPPPSRVLDEVAAFARSLDASASGEQRRCAAAAWLYALWPPCRVVVLDPRWLGGGASQPLLCPPSGLEGDEPLGPRSGRERLSSRCGGLVLWAVIAAGSGLEARLRGAYRSARTQSAARWAIGRSLSQPSQPEGDPLLALWAGEPQREPGSAARLVNALDPEPLFEASLGWARERGLLDRPLVLGRFGDRVAAVTVPEHLIVDLAPSADPEAAAAEVVARFSARVGHPPPVLRAGALPAAVLEAVAEIDQPSLPGALRPAVLCFASCLRASLRARLGVKAARVRGWPALVEPGEQASVLLRSADLSPLLRGAPLPTLVPLGGLCARIVVS